MNGVGAFLGSSCAVCVQSHIQVVHVRNSFLMKPCRLVLEGIIDEEKNILTWFTKLTRNLRDTPQLDAAVPPVPPTIFPVALHGARRARHRVDVAASGSGRGAVWKKCRGNRDLVKPSKIAPGCGGETRPHPTDIWWNIGTFVLYLVPEKMSFEYEEWAEWLDYIGFRSTGFQICPKHLPLLWVYLAPLFDHIWLFLLPKSRVIEVPNKRFCKYPKRSFVSSSCNVTCAKIPVAHRVKPKKEGSRILCGYISRWRYGCLTWWFNTWWFTLITASLEKKHWLFFSLLFSLVISPWRRPSARWLCWWRALVETCSLTATWIFSKALNFEPPQKNTTKNSS